MRYTIKDFQTEYDTDEKCLNFIFRQKWPDGRTCRCGKVGSFHLLRGRKAYGCAWCGAQLSPTAGTIFHKSCTSLRFWFYAMFLMTASKNGVSAKELERQLGVTYKTAWRMAHQIRRLMEVQGGRLWGTVEADETFIGGRTTNMHVRHRKNPGARGSVGKAIVAGIVEKGGEVRAQVVRDTRATTLVYNIAMTVEQGSEIHTDECNAYAHLRHCGYTHGQVTHADAEWVRNDPRYNSLVHTNTIEGFWSQLKRSINGTFHQVSPKHLQRYVDEFVYRYNRRKLETPLFHDLSGRVGRMVPAARTA
jgi:transposase